jgi:hypothetical protein
MVYCKNCGKELPSVDSVICPACGVAQREIATTVVSIQTKNSGTATIIALIAGFFGFNGIGHIYIGKTSFGIGLMIIGWILAFLTAIGVFGSMNSSWFAWFLVAGIGYLVYWIWQAYDANEQAKYYNVYVKKNGKEPW